MKIRSTQQKISPKSSFTPVQTRLLQRQCACGGSCTDCRGKQLSLQRASADETWRSPLVPTLGHKFSQMAIMQPKLKVNQAGDIWEQEAERVAATIVNGSAIAHQPLAQANSSTLQREEPKQPPSDADKYKEGAKKVGEAFLETPVGKQLKEKAKKLGSDFLATLPGKIITGTAAVGAVTAIAATNSELPMQVPEIPLDVLTPGLKMKLTYEGPVQKPTAASISFTYTIGAGSSEKKPAMTEAEKFRAETARMAAEQAKFREGLKTPEQRAKESDQFWDAYWRMKSLEPGNLLGIPGLKLKKPTETLQPKKLEDESIQRQETDNKKSVDSVPQVVDETLAQSGQPLDNTTRRFMESRFGHDFSRVRVHNNAKAAESAQAVNARAYTVGKNIVFGTGEYAPNTTAGQKLLAHELTHILQQR